jgi:hypothetical protein
MENTYPPGVRIDFSTADAYGVSIIRDENQSLMEGCFSHANRIVNEITQKMRDYKSSRDGSKPHRMYRLDYHSEFNNIIAFTGERGSGKSTAMLTYIYRLCEPDKNGGAKSWNGYELNVVPISDPSKFAPGETVVGTVVAHIYSRIQEIIETQDCVSKKDLIRKAYECCEKVHSTLKVRYKGVEQSLSDMDELESLDKLASTALLKEELYELISAYLQVEKGREHAANQVLVIPIDDLDMRVNGSYQILEEIRNFLFSKNVIVIISAKFEQLSDSVEQYFYKQLESLPSTRSVLDAQPAEMASKYLQKLIPPPRRIALPVFKMDTLVSVMVRTAKTEATKKEHEGYTPPADYFLECVWKTTGILLVKNDSNSHMYPGFPAGLITRLAAPYRERCIGLSACRGLRRPAACGPGVQSIQ